MLCLGRKAGQGIVLSVREVTITVTLLRFSKPEVVLTVSAIGKSDKYNPDLGILVRRNLGESLFLTLEEDQIEILIAEFEHGGVRFGILCPKSVRIFRREVAFHPDQEDQHAKAI